MHGRKKTKQTEQPARRGKGFTIPEADLKALEEALATGIGLTKATQLLQMDIRQVSAYLKENEAIMTRLLHAVKKAAVGVVLASSSALQTRDYSQWQQGAQKAMQFTTELVLWESIAPQYLVKPGTVLAAYGKYRNWDEVATACGFTSMEMQQYLNRVPNIALFIKQNPALYQ